MTPPPTGSSSVSCDEAVPALSRIRSPKVWLSGLTKTVPAAPQVAGLIEGVLAPAATVRPTSPGSMTAA